MATYVELKTQAEALLKQAEEARLAELQVVIDEVRARVAEYGLAPEQVFGRRKTVKGGSDKKGATPVAKYQDPKTGATWSGRGREPHWIKRKMRERFLIPE